MSNSHHLLEQIEKLTEIGISLSAEHNTERLLESILLEAKRLTHADGGTLYSVQEDGTVRMEIMHTDSLNFAMGGTTGKAIPFAPIPLYDAAGQPNHHMVVTHAVLHDRTINIPDAYDADGFDFSGTKSFDASTGYRSTSFLTVPMKDHEGVIIGVLQLLNAQDEESGAIIPFGEAAQKLAESLASQAAIALTNRHLIDDLKNLLESLIRLIATAIDEKSPYTGGHCKRVPELVMALAEAAHRTREEPFRAFRMNEDDRYELRMAAWLHDCGKITTPEAVVDKATKLETIYDRIEVVATRFELLKRDAEIAMLKRHLTCRSEDEQRTAREEYEKHLGELDEEFDFLRHSNTGGEFMSAAGQERVRQIGQRRWQQGGQELPLLSADELHNLTIQKGTLTPEEREVINNHIVATIRMLESLPFPKKLRHVPEFAGGHHEKMDGSGYPRGLTGEQMSLQARIMAIADIFEALTAKDRPYKEGKTLSEALHILGLMTEEHHIDPDLFRLFIKQQIYRQYADSHLSPEQIDVVDITSLPGYR
jgi:HD-GYP domain-containing protein (c-di-GMP phosphodiesterase class II)